jgi:adenylosuccinate synthase
MTIYAEIAAMRRTRGRKHGVSEKEAERWRRAVARLMDAQQEALDTAEWALELRVEDEDEDADDWLSPNERLEAALRDVRAILSGASEDVRHILAEGSA